MSDDDGIRETTQRLTVADVDEVRRVVREELDRALFGWHAQRSQHEPGVRMFGTVALEPDTSTAGVVGRIAGALGDPPALPVCSCDAISGHRSWCAWYVRPRPGAA